ncbi:Hypothetical predicted protein [Marmota monax]|uniref:Uncharacterized protein n=2 Tax=Marmota monax TaxID=9995 RepID=A0A5E4ATU5_MARMO|nr:hypothetical protein GHT09_006755 [Marmota monax]VTJ59962.1 Hypothetical predicted protein [Marmota monax]
MDDSSSGSSCPDMEHCISESKSYQSLSIGYFPAEDNVASEGITPCEDVTSEDPPSLPPDEGPWGTNGVTGPMGRRNEIQEKPEEPGEEDMDEPMNGDVCSLFDYSQMKWAEWEEDDEESMYNWQEETRCQSVLELIYFLRVIAVCLDKDEEDDDSLFADPHREEDVDDSVPPESPQEEENVQPSSSVSSHMDQVSPEEQEACQDLPKYQPAENGDTKQSPEMPPGLEEDEIVEMESQEPGTAKSSLGSSEQSEEGDLPSDKEGTSCVNFRRFFHWLRKRVVSSLPGRKRREKAKKVSSCWR